MLQLYRGRTGSIRTIDGVVKLGQGHYYHNTFGATRQVARLYP